MGLVFALCLITAPIALAVLDLSRMRGKHLIGAGSKVRSRPISPVDKGRTAHSSEPTGGSYSI